MRDPKRIEPILNFFRITLNKIKVITIKGVYEENCLYGFRYATYDIPDATSDLVYLNNKVDVAEFVITVEKRLTEIL